MACRCWVITTRRSEMTGGVGGGAFPARLVKSFTMRFRGNVAGAWPMMTMRVSGLSAAMRARLIGQVR